MSQLANLALSDLLILYVLRPGEFGETVASSIAAVSFDKLSFRLTHCSRHTNDDVFWR
jgi:hypothetical protein